MQEPHLGDLGHHGQRHDQHGHHQVGHGQRQDQVVGHVVQRPLQDDRGDDEAVADDAAEDHDAQDDAGADEVLLAVYGQSEGRTQAGPVLAARVPRPAHFRLLQVAGHAGQAAGGAVPQGGVRGVGGGVEDVGVKQPQTLAHVVRDGGSALCCCHGDW